MFKKLAQIEIANKGSQLLVSLLLVLLGLGLDAFIIGLLTGIIIQMCLVVTQGRFIFKPNLIFVFNEIRSMVSFGLYQMGERTVNYFNYQIDVLIIGKIFSSEILGLYNMGKQIALKVSQLINPIITKVVFPVLSKVQNEPKAFTRIIEKMVHLVTSINLPIYALIYLFSNEIADVFLGSEWSEVGSLLKIMVIFAAMRSIQSPTGIVTLAKGKANWGFSYSLFMLFYIPPAIYLFKGMDVYFISWTLVVLMALLFLPNWFIFIRSLTQSTAWSYHKGPVIVTLSCVIPVGLLMLLLPYLDWSSLVKLIIGAPILIALIVTCFWFFDRSFLLEIKETGTQKLRAIFLKA